jgi:hypothetical protein
MDTKMKVWALASATVLGLSAVLPWVTALGTSYSLMEGADGPILLGAGLLTAAAVLWRPAHIGVRLVALATAGLGLYEAIHVWTAIKDARDEAEGFGALVGVGMGVYIAGLVALALAAWAITTQVRKLPPTTA